MDPLFGYRKILPIKIQRREIFEEKLLYLAILMFFIYQTIVGINLISSAVGINPSITFIALLIFKIFQLLLIKYKKLILVYSLFTLLIFYKFNYCLTTDFFNLRSFLIECAQFSLIVLVLYSSLFFLLTLMNILAEWKPYYSTDMAFI